MHNNPHHDGEDALKGMILLDEIRGRLAEVWSLQNYKIEQSLYGAIASACTYGAMLNATPEQIESAIGLIVAHYVPFRAARYEQSIGHSKAAYSAIATETAI